MMMTDRSGSPVMVSNVSIPEFCPNKISVSRLSPTINVFFGSNFFEAKMASIMCAFGFPITVGVILVE